jgi:hypothetical protein
MIGKWKWVDYVGMLEGKDLGQSELWNGRGEVIQSILCRELLDAVYIATPLILTQYVSGTQLEHSGIPI